MAPKLQVSRMMTSAASTIIPSLICRRDSCVCGCNHPCLQTCVQTQSRSTTTACSRKQQLKLSGMQSSPPVAIHVGLRSCLSQFLSPHAVCLKCYLHHFRYCPPSSPRWQHQAEGNQWQATGTCQLARLHRQHAGKGRGRPGSIHGATARTEEGGAGACPPTAMGLRLFFCTGTGTVPPPQSTNTFSRSHALTHIVIATWPTFGRWSTAASPLCLVGGLWSLV